MVTSVETELVRLRRENAELRAGLEARTQENAVLLQTIGDVISTLKLDQVLQHIVDHLVAAFDCHAAFIYLWEPGRERLVLRGASAPYRHFIGRIELGQGEGLVGWSALTRKPAMLRERALEDPRFRYFPELEEERFQAMLTVPMTGSDGAVVAVVSMHTVAPQEFTDEHVRQVGAMAPLLGSAIEASELYENTTRKLAVLSSLSGLVQSVHGGRQLDEALRRLAETTVRVTASDLCVLILAEPGGDGLSLRGYTSPRDGEHGAVVTGTLERRPWDQLAAISSPAGLGLSELAWTQDEQAWKGAHMAAPLVATGEQLGLMMCYGASIRQYGDDDVALLNIIANQAAITAKNSQLADLLAERDVPARLFRDLVQGPEEGEDLVRRRAALLGSDLSRPHVPAVLDLAGARGQGEYRGGHQAAGRLARRWLAETYPGSVVHVEAAILALIQVPEENDGGLTVAGALDALQPAIEREVGLRLVGGLGRVCHAISDYRRGFAQARDALRVARTLRRAGVLHFDGLGAARYLTRIPAPAGEELRDRYQDCVERVAAYDARKGTALLRTLDVYLSSGGSIARTAEHLYVHRNTLVQRLEKLHDLLGLDPHDSDHWLALHIALALRHLQEP